MNNRILAYVLLIFVLILLLAINAFAQDGLVVYQTEKVE